MLNKYEFRRKAVHLVLGVLFVVFINLDIILAKYHLELLLLGILVLTMVMSIYTKHKKPKLIISVLRLFDKPQDLIKFPGKGAVFYTLGALVAVAFFDREVASASIIILAVGDPIAHFIGRYYGKTRIVINRKKLLEGTLAGIFFGCLAASYFVPWHIAFFGAAFGMMSEALEVEYLNLDDNFFIPFVSGTVMTIIFALS